MLISRLFILTGTLLFVQKVFSLNKSICGLSDSRIPSFDRKVGRLQKLNANKGGCTITLIGRTCGISAGHCEGSFVESHFNVPRSDSNGHIRLLKDGNIDMKEFNLDLLNYFYYIFYFFKFFEFYINY